MASSRSECRSAAVSVACGVPSSKKGNNKNQYYDDWPREQALERKLAERACRRRHQLCRIVSDAILEHEFHVAHVRDIARRVALKDHEVGLHAFSNCSHGAIVKKSRPVR